MRQIRRLVFVPGPWQMLLAAGAMQQAGNSSGLGSRDDLIIFSLSDGPIARPMLEVMKRMAPAVWPWRRILFLDGATDWDLRDARRPVEALRAFLGPEEPDEIWMVRLTGEPEKVAAEAYPAARLVLYEDGLHSYLPGDDHHLAAARLLSEPRNAYRAVKLRIRERRRPEDLTLAAMLPRHLARVVASYHWISLMIPMADYQRRLPWIQLQTHFVKEAIERVSPLVDAIDVGGGNGRRAIVLGQCFSNYGDLARDAELDCYANMARRLQGMGYEVIWKEHPRTRRLFLTEELTQAVAGISVLPDLGPWPVELFVERLGLAACASMTSTSLFNLPLLFRLPSFSPAGRYLTSLRFPNDVMAQLVARSIPSID